MAQLLRTIVAVLMEANPFNLLTKRVYTGSRCISVPHDAHSTYTTHNRHVALNDYSISSSSGIPNC